MNKIVRTQKRVYTAGIVAAAAVALLVSGCSDTSDSDSGGGSSEQSPAAASEAGASSAAVDGKALEADFDATCAKQGDTLALALADTANATYGDLAVSATVTGTDTVQAVGIAGSKGGSNGLPYALGFGQGMPGGSATVVKDGDTYTITGEGVGAPDMSNPTAPSSSKFDITFACSTVVGG
ncbi:lipoprotein LpqH [Rhodococcus opacus]|uniref:Lipoprotein LpqH n=2 Tax=Rhodococcus opacus TaxID=37919 RepID=A0AAX3YCA4_RHOOP|nr:MULTISPECIES: lipoprotein LpqH [Rhodococcus]NHU46176.1 lipoprotein LpqH [Rhodococcus sp. A14]EKT79039.1 19 kDa lipoprotein antigen [Rhodococcus opacus M213]MBA8961445.1 lipoprotein LpqH [Rhodococcus opacus]MBP2202691.1 lipoprotein LpqH [Rhodococcus opacus]MCZ4583321.1 lipoprotein LpqH [Rhodococcus opacus]